MKRKLLFILLCVTLLSTACARGRTVKGLSGAGGPTPTTATILWGSHAGNKLANNIIGENNSFPSGTPTFLEAGLTNPVHSAPVIYTDNSIQNVFILDIESGNNLIVKKFTYASGELTSTPFSLTNDSGAITLKADSDTNNQKAHQIALKKEIGNGNIFIYVSHANGITKFNTDGVQQAEISTPLEPVYRILIDGEFIFFHSKTRFFKANLALTAQTPTDLGTQGTPLIRPLPLILSTNKFYFQVGNNIHCHSISSTVTCDTITITQPSTGSKYVGNMAANSIDLYYTVIEKISSTYSASRFTENADTGANFSIDRYFTEVKSTKTNFDTASKINLFNHKTNVYFDSTKEKDLSSFTNTNGRFAYVYSSPLPNIDPNHVKNFKDKNVFGDSKLTSLIVSDTDIVLPGTGYEDFLYYQGFPSLLNDHYGNLDRTDITASTSTYDLYKISLSGGNSRDASPGSESHSDLITKVRSTGLSEISYDTAESSAITRSTNFFNRFTETGKSQKDQRKYNPIVNKVAKFAFSTTTNKFLIISNFTDPLIAYVDKLNSESGYKSKLQDSFTRFGFSITIVPSSTELEAINSGINTYSSEVNIIDTSTRKISSFGNNSNDIISHAVSIGQQAIFIIAEDGSTHKLIAIGN